MSEHLGQCIGIERARTGHALLEGLHAGRDGLLVVGNFRREADRVLRVHRILQSQVQGHGLVQPKGGVVERVTE